MARTSYPRELDQVIWTLLCAGRTPGEIRKALSSNDGVYEPLGGPIEIPVRTLTDKVARLKEARGEPPSLNGAADEIEAFGNRVMTLANRELDRLFDLEYPEPKDIDRLVKWLQAVERVANHKSWAPKDAKTQLAGRERQLQGATKQIFDEIRAEEARTAQSSEHRDEADGKTDVTPVHA